MFGIARGDLGPRAHATRRGQDYTQDHPAQSDHGHEPTPHPPAQLGGRPWPSTQGFVELSREAHTGVKSKSRPVYLSNDFKYLYQ